MGVKQNDTLSAKWQAARVNPTTASSPSRASVFAAFSIRNRLSSQSNRHLVAARLVVVDCLQGSQPGVARTCYCIKDCLQGKLYDNFPLSTNDHPPSNVKRVLRRVVSGKIDKQPLSQAKLCTDVVGEKEPNHR